MRQKLLDLAALILEHANQTADEKLIKLANELSDEVQASTTDDTEDTGGSNPPPNKERP